MLGVYNYTVVMTYVAMIVSFMGISYVLDGNYKAALLCLMVSGVLDMFDGKVASTKKNRTYFQKKLWNSDCFHERSCLLGRTPVNDCL